MGWPGIFVTVSLGHFPFCGIVLKRGPAFLSPDSSLLIVCEEQCPCRKWCIVTPEGAKGRSLVIRQADLRAVKPIFLAQCVCSRGSLDCGR